MISSELLHSLAEQYGTPLYVYDGDVIERQWNGLLEVVRGRPHLLCYAVKANSTLGILRLIHSWGGGFDIVSGGELRRVEKVGGDTGKVVFAGVGKTTEEIEYALHRSIRFFNVESPEELSQIEEIARRSERVARVSLRINPHIDVATHPYLATGLATSKFGIPTAAVAELREFCSRSPYVELVGVDCHIGSQISDLGALERAYGEVLSLAHALETRGAPIRHVDFGGGIAVSYSGQYESVDLHLFGAMVQRLLHGSTYEVIFEPGKFLVAESGVLLTKVLLTKSTGQREFAIVDAGMNDLIRPALYEAHHKIERIPCSGEEPSKALREVDVAGPVCESGCVFAKGVPLPPLMKGDLLALRDAGAYGMTMASNYNSRRRPAEVLVYRGVAKCIRAREPYEALWEGEDAKGFDPQ